jgi:hypothetical protein
VDDFVVTDKVQPKQLDPPSEPPVAPWRSATRLAFRFSFAYLALFSFASQILGSLVLIPNVSFRGFGWLWPMREMTFWFGKHLFHIASPLVYDGNSRDSDFYWVQAFWILLYRRLAHWSGRVSTGNAPTTSRSINGFVFLFDSDWPLRCWNTE